MHLSRAAPAPLLGHRVARGPPTTKQHTIRMHNCNTANHSWGLMRRLPRCPRLVMLCASAKLLCLVSRRQQGCHAAVSAALRARHASAFSVMAVCEKVSFGDAVPGYVWGQPGQPGVVVIQEWWGVNEQVRLPERELTVTASAADTALLCHRAPAGEAPRRQGGCCRLPRPGAGPVQGRRRWCVPCACVPCYPRALLTP